MWLSCLFCHVSFFVFVFVYFLSSLALPSSQNLLMSVSCRLGSDRSSAWAPKICPTAWLLLSSLQAPIAVLTTGPWAQCCSECTRGAGTATSCLSSGVGWCNASEWDVSANPRTSAAHVDSAASSRCMLGWCLGNEQWGWPGWSAFLSHWRLQGSLITGYRPPKQMQLGLGRFLFAPQPVPFLGFMGNGFPLLKLNKCDTYLGCLWWERSAGGNLGLFAQP